MVCAENHDYTMREPDARSFELIGAACGRGGADPGCAQGPARLLAAGLEAHLRQSGVRAAWGSTISTQGGGSPLAVSRFCARLAGEVARSLSARCTPCVIGGDHSIAVGTWTGASVHGGSRPIGLVWIDAHLDSHTPRTSPSGRPHGMPVATLLGQGDDQLAGFAAAVVDPRHLCLVGARSYEREERGLLERLGVRIIDHRELRERGAAAFAEAIGIAAAADAGFGVSIDLDVIDPGEAPGVATPAPSGIALSMLASGLRGIGRHPALLALEIAEYCPRRDREGITERTVLELLAACLGERAGDDAQILAHALHAQEA